MLKVTVRNMLQSQGSVQALVRSRLPAKAAYAVSKLAAACEHEAKHFEKERLKVFTDAGCTLVENKWTHADKAVYDASIKRVEEMADAEVELNALPLALEQFGSAEVPGGVFIGLEWAMLPME